MTKPAPRDPKPVRKPQRPKPRATRQPIPREREAIRGAMARYQERRPRFQVTADTSGKTLGIAPRHDDYAGHAAWLHDAFGTTSGDFAQQALGRLASIARQRGAALPTERELNAALAAVDGVQPRDEVEAMLAVQMYATHEVAMEFLTRAKLADTVPAVETCGLLAIKLLRTYTAQVEALAKLRRGGEQTVRVEHVHVHPGGQAIVGMVSADPATPALNQGRAVAT